MSELSPTDIFKSTARRCKMVFAAVVCGTLLAVAAAYAPLGNPALRIALILTAACGNAFLVAGYLMHLLSERKMIHAVLAFTAFFFVGLMGLTVWATNGFPPGTVAH